MKFKLARGPYQGFVGNPRHMRADGDIRILLISSADHPAQNDVLSILRERAVKASNVSVHRRLARTDRVVLAYVPTLVITARS